MTRLVAGMYSSQQNSNLFGIRFSQIRSHDFVHNGGWFGADGAMLGSGDLDLRDIARIRDELQPGEAFIILGESDSHETRWNPDYQSDKRGEAAGPTLDYVIQHARHAIFPGETLQPLHPVVYDYQQRRGEMEYTSIERTSRYSDVSDAQGPQLSVTFRYISSEELRQKLTK